MRPTLRSAEGRPQPGRPGSARGRRGLTLLELMCVLAVLAVLGAMALPSMHGSLQRHRLQAAAQRLAADLAEARFEAARAGHALYLQPQADAVAGWCWAVARTPGCDCRQAPACALHTVPASEHPGVQLLQGQTAVLQPEGTAQQPLGGTVALLQGRGGERLRVDLTPLGRPRICVAQGQVPGLSAC